MTWLKYSLEDTAHQLSYTNIATFVNAQYFVRYRRLGTHRNIENTFEKLSAS